MRRLGAGLREALVKPAQSGDVTASAPGAANPGPGSGPTPGLDLLADLTGTTREGLTGNYEAIGRALRTYFTDLTDTVLDAVEGDSQAHKAARERMNQWARTLRAHGIAVPETSEGVGAGAPDPDAPPGFADAASGGTQAAATERTAAAGLADSLRRLAESFQRRAETLAAARRAADESGGERGESDDR
jgi:hypothetical protein